MTIEVSWKQVVLGIIILFLLYGNYIQFRHMRSMQTDLIETESAVADLIEQYLTDRARVEKFMENQLRINEILSEYLIILDDRTRVQQRPKERLKVPSV